MFNVVGVVVGIGVVIECRPCWVIAIKGVYSSSRAVVNDPRMC